MMDSLYERFLPTGPLVRVRRTTPPGVRPVRAVLEIDRRAGHERPGESPGIPPQLLAVQRDSESAALSELLDIALEDAELAKLMRDRGLR